MDENTFVLTRFEMERIINHVFNAGLVVRSTDLRVRRSALQKARADGFTIAAYLTEHDSDSE